MRDLYHATSLYAVTHAIHTSALTDGETMLLAAEDVGWHYTKDRLWGKALMHNVPTRGLILLATGRINSEMLAKAANRRTIMVNRTVGVPRGSRWVIAGLLVLELAACSGGTAVPATIALPAAVNIRLQTYSVTPDLATVKAGAITFNVTNAATDQQHEFVVIRSDLAADKLPVGGDGTVDGKAVTVIDKIALMDPGKSGTLAVTLAAGHYVLICNRPGHYQAGMYTDFTATP